MLYHSIKQRWIARKLSTSKESTKRNVREIRTFQGRKDIERLNRLIHEKGAIDDGSVISSSTENIRECSKAANKALIEILSRTIARTDELETTMQQIVSTIYDIKK